MAMRESRMLEEVRRWRRAVYERRKGMTPAQLAKHDREVLEKAGLLHLLEPDSPAKPTSDHRQAG